MSATDMEIEAIIEDTVIDSALLNLRGIKRRPIKEIVRDAHLKNRDVEKFIQTTLADGAQRDLHPVDMEIEINAFIQTTLADGDMAMEIEKSNCARCGSAELTHPSRCDCCPVLCDVCYTVVRDEWMVTTDKWPFCALYYRPPPAGRDMDMEESIQSTVIDDLRELHGIKPRPTFDAFGGGDGAPRCMRCGIRRAEIIASPCDCVTLCASCHESHCLTPFADRCPACAHYVERWEEVTAA
jgi:hypothetical protein